MEECADDYKKRRTERILRSQELREFLCSMEPYSILYKTDSQDWSEESLQFEEVDVSGSKFIIEDDIGCARLIFDTGQVIFYMLSSVDFDLFYGSTELFYIDLVCYDILDEIPEKTYRLYGKKI